MGGAAPLKHPDVRLQPAVAAACRDLTNALDTLIRDGAKAYAERVRRACPNPGLRRDILNAAAALVEHHAEAE